MADYCSAVPHDSDHVANDEELENLGKIQSPDIRSFQRLRESAEIRSVVLNRPISDFNSVILA